MFLIVCGNQKEVHFIEVESRIEVTGGSEVSGQELETTKLHTMYSDSRVSSVLEHREVAVVDYLEYALIRRT